MDCVSAQGKNPPNAQQLAFLEALATRLKTEIAEELGDSKAKKKITNGEASQIVTGEETRITENPFLELSTCPPLKVIDFEAEQLI